MPLPDYKDYEYGYRLAYKLACEALARIHDIGEQCQKSGAQYIDAQRIILVEYLNQSCQITFPDIEVLLKESDKQLPLKEKILILHYLAQAKGTKVGNKMIAYKELPEGAIYFPTFAKRAIKPILETFAAEPERLLETAATKLGGYKAGYGDTAVTINAFPRVPITIVLWRGDAELPPEGNIIFDSTIPDYLTTEDINILCENIAWRLVKN